MEFLDVVARWAGSTHDSRIFQMSRVNMRYLERQLSGALLGDNGYPALRYLLTPLLNPQTEAERRYNRAHIKARNIVERGFGVWKSRFPCLKRGLGNALPTVSNIIVACAVLHNIAMAGNEELPNDDDDDDDQEPFVPVDPVPFRIGEGHAVRQALIHTHFAGGKNVFIKKIVHQKYIKMNVCILFITGHFHNLFKMHTKGPILLPFKNKNH